MCIKLSQAAEKDSENCMSNMSTPSTDVPKANPYSLKKSKVHMNNRLKDINTFLSIVTDYVNIIIKHDESPKQESW